MQRKHAAASVTRCTIHLPPTAVGEGDYGIPCAGQSQGSPISHRSIWESLRHSESGTHLLGVHAELEITLANGHMYIHIQGFINKTRAATLSLQPRFHQQDAGSHAFLSVKVSSTRRGQPRFHSSRGFINKYIQTNIHSLTEDPCIFYLFWDKPFTCSHTIITYGAG